MSVIEGIHDVLLWCWELFETPMNFPGGISFSLLEVFGVVVCVGCAGVIVGTAINGE